MKLFYSFSGRKAFGRYPLIFTGNIAGDKLAGSFFASLLSISGAGKAYGNKVHVEGMFGVNSRLTSCCFNCYN